MPNWLNRRVGVALLAALLICVILRACFAVIPAATNENATRVQKMDSPTVDLRLNEYGDQLVRRSQVKIDRGSVGGLIFWEISGMATRTEPMVRLLHEGAELQLPRARSVTLVEDSQQRQPIGVITLKFKMPSAPDDAGKLDEMARYDAAVFALYRDILSSVRRAGWSRFISLDAPRIVGPDSYKFLPTYRRAPFSKSSNADPDYSLSFEDWRQLADDASWAWYREGAKIRLTYTRSPRQAGYSVHDELRMEILSDRSIMLLNDPRNNSDLEAGIAAYRERIPESLRKRRELEERARAAGVPILTSYVDPAVGGIPIPKMEAK